MFLFEDAPASDRRPDELYLNEVETCDIYVGLFGDDYGTEDEEGVSPTEREFDYATVLGKHRLVFLKRTVGSAPHPKMQAPIGKAQAGLIRKRFSNEVELVAGLYAALVEYLDVKELIRREPFDASPCSGAVPKYLDQGRMSWFIRTARTARQFPLAEDTSAEDLLEHLNLRKNGRLTNAAVLLFGGAPQRFLISSEIKCAHFHGTQVAKPIPSYQVYKGTVFDLVDHAVDFVLSKIALSVGTRAESVQAPVAYEIPKEVVTEAIVNAVAHRDYTSAGSVQVMLFADRLEVWNPGRLPPPLTLEKLRVPHESIPGNPLLARAMYLVKYIEQMGTGTLDMIERCVSAGLREPEFEASGEFVTRIWRAALAGQLKDNEPKRIALYKLAAAYLRAYADLANEMREAGYSDAEARAIKSEVDHYEKVRQEVKLASGDYIDLKMYEPAMRHLLDTYIRAEESETLSAFDDMTLVQLVVERGEAAIDSLPAGIRENRDAVAETIENNVRRIIIDEMAVNPKYYEKMSELLDALINQRKQEAIDYKAYLEKIVALTKRVSRQESERYPHTINSPARRALYDNLKDIPGLEALMRTRDKVADTPADVAEAAALAVDDTVRAVKKADWRGNRFKEREVRRAIKDVLQDDARVDEVFEIVKAQHAY